MVNKKKCTTTDIDVEDLGTRTFQVKTSRESPIRKTKKNKRSIVRPWYLRWDGPNMIQSITMIFKSKSEGMKYLLPILGKPKVENDQEVYWDYDAYNKSEEDLDKLFDGCDTGNGEPYNPTLLPVVFGKPLVGWSLD